MGWFQSTWDKVRGKSAAEKARTSAQASGDEYVTGLEGAYDASQVGYDTMMGMYDNADPMQQYINQVTGGVDQNQLMADAQNNPMYQAQLGQIGNMKQNAIDSSMSTASATGGLRGGNLQQGFADIATEESLQQQQALSNSYNQMYQQGQTNLGQLGQLGGQQGNLIMNQAQNNADWMGNIAGAQHAADMGAQQTYQDGRAAGMSNLFGGIGALTGAANAGVAAFAASDERLKENIKKVGTENGFNIYTWDWKESAPEYIKTEPTNGVIAQEVQKIQPEAVITASDGFLRVDYKALGLEH